MLTPVEHQMQHTYGSRCGFQARRFSRAGLGILLLTVLHHVPAAIAEPPNPLLEDIRFEKVSSQEERIRITIRDFSPPELFAIEGDTPRVVCDFLGASLAAEVKTQYTLNGNYIKRIRLGAHRDPTKIRVVLDLSPEHDHDVRQMYVADQGVFILAITPLDLGSDTAKGDASSPSSRPVED